MSKTISSIQKPALTKAAVLFYTKKDNSIDFYRESIVIHTSTVYAYETINELLDEFCTTVEKSKQHNYCDFGGYVRACVRFEGIINLSFYNYNEVIKYFEEVIDILNKQYSSYLSKNIS